jgi:hypothetical protein
LQDNATRVKRNSRGQSANDPLEFFEGNKRTINPVALTDHVVIIEPDILGDTLVTAIQTIVRAQFNDAAIRLAPEKIRKPGSVNTANRLGL